MIELDSLTVENFGPFLGEQTLDFGGHQGVYVIHGNNGHGKTTLLNAFRWAFTGKAAGRTGPRRNDELINRAAVKDSGSSPVDMQVTVKFQVDGSPYEVRRKLTRKPDGNTSHSLSLIENGNVLSKEDAPKRLNEILPADIQQFFFFDAELINQFEDLLEHKSHVASQLKESIEAVLGIPVLRDAAATLRQIDEATTKDFKNHVKGNKKRKEISETVAKLQKRVEALRESIKAAKEAAAKAHSRIRELEHRLKDNEVAQRLIQEREHEEGRLKELRESAKGALESLQDAAEDGWKAVLHDVVDGQTATLNERAVEVSENLDRVRRDSFLAELRREAAKTGTCPCCGLDHQKSKQDKVDKSESETDRLAEELQGIRSQVSVLERLGSGFVQGALASAHKNNYEARNRLSLAESAIQELKEKLVGINEADVHEVAQEHANQTILLEKANSLKEENEKDLFEVREDIARLQKSFVEEGDDDLSDLQRKIDLVNGLAEFFDQASEAYREDQKARVEEEATKIFLSVAHQDQYERLQITETYGLQIIHEDGTIEKGRSSGYEHIVAVSLIGALQKTSPVKGPVVMDSPFGRLDIEHGNNVIALLPELAPQVLLLVTDRELDTKTVSKVLDPNQLIAERNLIQVSARHTQIETLGGGS